MKRSTREEIMAGIVVHRLSCSLLGYGWSLDNEIEPTGKSYF